MARSSHSPFNLAPNYARRTVSMWCEPGVTPDGRLQRQQQGGIVLLGTEDGHVYGMRGGHVEWDVKTEDGYPVSINVVGYGGPNALIIATCRNTETMVVEDEDNAAFRGSMTVYRYPGNGETPYVIRKFPIDHTYATCVDVALCREEAKPYAVLIQSDADGVGDVDWDGKTGVIITSFDSDHVNASSSSSPDKIKKNKESKAELSSTYLSVYTSLERQLGKASNNDKRLRSLVSEKDALIEHCTSLLLSPDKSSASPGDACATPVEMSATRKRLKRLEPGGFLPLVKDDVDTGSVSSTSSFTEGILHREWRTLKKPHTPIHTPLGYPPNGYPPSPIVADRVGVWYEEEAGTVRIVASMRNTKATSIAHVSLGVSPDTSMGICVHGECDVCPVLRGYAVAQLQLSMPFNRLRVTAMSINPRTHILLVLTCNFRTEGQRESRVVRVARVKVPLWPGPGVVGKLDWTSKRVRAPLAYAKPFRYTRCVFLQPSQGLSDKIRKLLQSIGLATVGGSELDVVLLGSKVGKADAYHETKWWRQKTGLGMAFMQVRVTRGPSGAEMEIFTDSEPKLARVLTSLSCISRARVGPSASQITRKLKLFLRAWREEVVDAITRIDHFLSAPRHSESSKKGGAENRTAAANTKGGKILRMLKSVRSLEMARDYMGFVCDHAQVQQKTNNLALRVLLDGQLCN